MPSYREMGTESPFFKAWFGNSKVVDEDGLPLPVYHGSTEQFDIFDPTKSRANMDIQGSFFSPWEIDAGGYGPNLHEVFLSLQNLGYDGVNNDSEEFIAFSPEQIKSTSNRGTFNPADPNIYKGVVPAVGAGGLLALAGVKKKNFRYAQEC